jgi:hypothetical protein
VPHLTHTLRVHRPGLTWSGHAPGAANEQNVHRLEAELATMA